MKNLKNIFEVVVVLFVVVTFEFFLSSVQVTNQSALPSPSRPTISQELQNMEKDINKVLPEKLDKFIRLNSVKSQGNTLEYFFTVLLNKGQDVGWQDLRDTIKERTHFSVCSQNELVRLLSREAKFVYKYKSLDGDFNEVYSLTISTIVKSQ